MQQPASNLDSFLEFWPDAEFKLPVGAGSDFGGSGGEAHHQLGSPLVATEGMRLPHEAAHNGDAIQHPAGHLAGLYGNGVAVDQPQFHQQQVRQTRRESGATSQARRCCRPNQSPVRLSVCLLATQDAAFSLPGTAAAAAPPAGAFGAPGPAALPVDSYTSSYGTEAAAGGGLGSAGLMMYPSFQPAGAKAEGEAEPGWHHPHLVLCLPAPVHTTLIKLFA